MGDLSVLEAVGIVLGGIAVVLSGMWLMLRQAFRGGINDRMLKELFEKLDKLPCTKREEEISDIRNEMSEIK